MKKLLIIILMIFLAIGVAYGAVPTTTNLELVKPAAEDTEYDWFDTMNANMDLIDAIFDTVTLTEYGYLDGVTSAIQTQINAKQPLDTALTNISGLTYVEDSLIKLTADDTYAVRTLVEVKSDLDLEIGTDVLAYQVIGIANDNLVEMDDADAAVDDYCKLTANGIVGRSYAEVKTDLGIDLSLYYLKTEINTLSKVETIYSKDIIDSDELAALKFTDLADTPANYTDQAGKYVKVNAGETALEFGTPAAGGGTVTTSGTPEVNDIARFTGATVIEGLTYDELTTALALTSDDLSDVASIAMLDEAEMITGSWKFSEILNSLYNDTPSTCPSFSFERARDGDPTSNVSDGDYLGYLDFYGQHTGSNRGAIIQAIVDGTPGDDDLPTRMEFYTSPDGTKVPVLRMAIDNAGNIKMGDGVWTDFIQTTSGGVMTAEGSATITATNLEPTVEIDFGAHSAGFTVQTITSSEGTATIDWGNSNKARITLSENTTLAFTDPANSGAYQLIIIQPAGENAYTTTFPAGIYWANSTKVSVPTTGSNRCIVSFLFDDEDASDVWYCQGTNAFATDD